MWLCMKWHGSWCTQNAPIWQQFHRVSHTHTNTRTHTHTHTNTLTHTHWHTHACTHTHTYWGARRHDWVHYTHFTDLTSEDNHWLSRGLWRRNWNSARWETLQVSYCFGGGGGGGNNVQIARRERERAHSLSETDHIRRACRGSPHGLTGECMSVPTAPRTDTTYNRYSLILYHNAGGTCLFLFFFSFFQLIDDSV